jgi:acyl dehydratase
MDVDETGRHDLAGRVELAFASQPAVYRHDPVAGYGDVRLPGRTTRAIDDGPSPDDDFSVGHRFLPAVVVTLTRVSRYLLTVPLDTSAVGKVSGRRIVTVERAPVTAFARAVKSRDRIYRDRRAALAAGFANVPAPPTFAFSMGYWGAYPELQEGLDPVESNPMVELVGALGPGLMLHGEQEFEYHRPVLVGDVLSGEDVIADVYQRESDTHVMTFIVTETKWRDCESGEPVVTARFNLVHRVRNTT